MVICSTEFKAFQASSCCGSMRCSLNSLRHVEYGRASRLWLCRGPGSDSVLLWHYRCQPAVVPNVVSSRVKWFDADINKAVLQRLRQAVTHCATGWLERGAASHVKERSPLPRRLSDLPDCSMRGKNPGASRLDWFSSSSSPSSLMLGKILEFHWERQDSSDVEHSQNDKSQNEVLIWAKSHCIEINCPWTGSGQAGEAGDKCAFGRFLSLSLSWGGSYLPCFCTCCPTEAISLECCSLSVALLGQLLKLMPQLLLDHCQSWKERRGEREREREMEAADCISPRCSRRFFGSPCLLCFSPIEALRVAALSNRQHPVWLSPHQMCAEWGKLFDAEIAGREGVGVQRGLQGRGNFIIAVFLLPPNPRLSPVHPHTPLQCLDFPRRLSACLIYFL